MGFFLPIQKPARESVEFPAPRSAKVRFEGPFRGALQVTMGEGALATLTMNMMGEFEPGSATEESDALCELTNVLCGNILPRIAGPKALFNIGPPQVVEGNSRQTLDALAAVAEVQLAFEEGSALVQLYLESAL